MKTVLVGTSLYQMAYERTRGRDKALVFRDPVMVPLGDPSAASSGEC